MYNVSANFLSAISAMGREIRGRVTINGTTYTDEDYLQSIEVTRSIQSEQKMIGNAISNQTTVKLISDFDGVSISGTVKTGMPIDVEIGCVLSDGTIEYVKYPSLTIESVDEKTVSGVIAITAYDALQRFNHTPVSVISGLAYPMTVSQYMQAICDAGGIEMEPYTGFDITISEQPNLSGTESLRTVLAYGAEALLSNVRISSSGKIKITPVFPLGTSVLQLTGEDYYTYDLNEKVGAINSLVLGRSPQEDNVYRQDDADILANGLHELRIDNNPFLDYGETDSRYDYLDTLFEKVNGQAYYPFTLDWRGNPAVEEGDIVTLSDIENQTVTTVYGGDTQTFNGGLRVKAELKGKSQTETDYTIGLSQRDVQRQAELRVNKVEGQITAVVMEQQEIQVSNDSRFEELEQRIQTNQTLIEQTANQIKASMSETGGSNMLANSVGYKDLAFWETSDPINYQIIQDAQTDQHTTSGSGIQLINGTIRQSFYTQQGMQYAVQFAYNKAGIASAESSVVLTADGTSIDVLRTTQEEDGYKDVLFVFEAQQPEYTLAISTNNDAFAVYDLRITAGDSGQAWSQGKDEVYGKGVLLDKTGITINPLEAGNVSMTMDNDSLYISEGGTLKAEVSDERIYGPYMVSENGIRIGDVEIRGLTRTRWVISGV